MVNPAARFTEPEVMIIAQHACPGNVCHQRYKHRSRCKVSVESSDRITTSANAGRLPWSWTVVVVDPIRCTASTELNYVVF